MIKQLQDVVVIGAGASGLAVAHELKARQVPCRILERTCQVASAWHGRHPQLRLNTHRALSGLPGQEFPASAGAFPRKHDVIDYFGQYAAQLEVPIEFDVSVSRIEKDLSGWNLHTNRGVLQVQHVVVATGQNRTPYVPNWLGVDSYAGTFEHAADFGHASDYRGKNILVIGAGNSGSDVLNHLTDIETAKIWVSIRHGPTVLPKRLLGIPVQRLSPLMTHMSDSIADKLVSLTEWLAFGDLAKFGLRKHAAGAITRLHQSGVAPAIDDGFVQGLKSGQIQIVPEVDRFGSNEVRLVDGRVLAPDVVIAATGYRTGLKEILAKPDILDEQGIPIIHGAEQLDAFPGLRFIGMRAGMTGYFHSACSAAKEIAEAILSERTARDPGGSKRMLCAIEKVKS